MQQKRAAMELSIGTIVIIVLAMSMLILGLILVRNIFSGSNKIVDMTNEQLLDEVGKMFGNEKKLVLYPASKRIEVKQAEINGFGIGIKNLGSGATDARFRYVVEVSDPDLMSKCNLGKPDVEKWLITGRTEDGIVLAPGDDTAAKVLIEVPQGSAICTFRLRVNVYKTPLSGGSETIHASDAMDVIIKG